MPDMLKLPTSLNILLIEDNEQLLEDVITKILFSLLDIPFGCTIGDSHFTSLEKVIGVRTEDS